MTKTIKLRLRKTNKKFIVLYAILNRSKLYRRIGFILLSGHTKYLVFNVNFFLKLLRNLNFIFVLKGNSQNSFI